MSKIRFHAYTDMPSTPLEEDSVIITRDGNYIKLFVTSQDGTPYEHRTIYTGEPNQIKIDDLHVSLDNQIIDEINSKIDEAFADSKYALRARTITAGDGLEGGGNLTANRTISLSSDTKSDIQKGVEAHDYTLDDVANNGNVTTVKLVGDEEFSNTEAEDYAQMADLWKAGYSIQYLNNEYKLVLRRKDDFIISEVDLSSLITGNLSVHIDDTDPADPELVFSQDGVEVGRIPASALLTGVVDTGELVGKQLHFKDRTGTVVINIDLSPVLDVKADKTVTISTGTGLSGGGNLSANRTVSLDTTYTDGRYQRSLTAGDNIDISSSRVISAIDTIYTAGNGLTLSGTSFTLPVSVTGSGSFVKSITQSTGGISVVLDTPPNTNTTYSNMTLAELNAGTVTTARSISAKTLNDWADGKYAFRSRTITGTGSLTGGGNLTANRTIDLSAATKSDIAKGVGASVAIPNKADKTTNIVAGTGLEGGGDLSENRTLKIGDGVVPLTSKTLTDADDLDYIIDPGYYRHSTGSIPANTPLNGAGYLETYKTGDFFKQNWSWRNGSRQFTRERNSGGDWSAWVEFWHSGNLTNVSQLTNDAGYITSSSLPTVNNGQLTLSTGAGLSGSATFTANQSGSSTFSVSVASTHKLPTTAEWNALPTTNTITRLRGTTSGAYTSGDLTLLAGANTTITQSGANITIASTNTNTTYSAGTGLSLSGTTFGQAITTNGTGSFVTGITQTTNGFQINLGTPPNTTYSAGTKALLDAGTNTTNRVWSAKEIATWGDGKFALRTRSITGTGSLTGGGNLTANRTIDLSSTTKSDIAKGVTAHGWGNHASVGYLTSSTLPSMIGLSYNTGDNIANNSSVDVDTLTGSQVFLSTSPQNLPFSSTAIVQHYSIASGTHITLAADYMGGKNDYYLGSGTQTSVNSNWRKFAFQDWVLAQNYATQVNIIQGSGISVTGTYPNLTITNTAPNATHTGDVTGSTALTIANSAVTHAKYQNIATQRILGRGAAGTGNVQELTLGTGLTLSTAGVLSASGSGGTVSSVGMTVAGTALTVSGSPITTSGTLALTWGGTSSQYVRGDGSLATIPTNHVTTSRSITAGNGLTGGGTLAANRTITLGTPTAIGLSTTNSVTSTSHTHALDSATTTAINNGQTAFGWGNHAGLYVSTSGESTIGNGGRLTIHNNDHSGWFNNTVGDTENYYTRRNFSINSANNQMSFFIHGASNSRRAGIQVGHSGSFANTGILELNPFGGDVRINGDTATHTGNLDVQATSLGFIKSADLSGYATETWVKSFGIGKPISQYNNVSVIERGIAGGLYSTTTTTTGGPMSGASGSLISIGSGVTNGTNSFIWITGNNANSPRAFFTHARNTGEMNTWEEIASQSWVNSQNFSTQTLSSSTSNIISGSTVQRAALTGDVTAAQNSNATTIANNAVTTAKIANSAVTHAKYQNIATQRILGRGATGTGNVQELTLGSNLSLSTGGVLSATNTTYSAGTLALLNAGTNTENRVWGAKPISDFVKSEASVGILLYTFSSVGVLAQDEEQPMKFTILQQDIGEIASVNSSNNNYITIEKEGVYEVTVRTNNNPGAREFNVYADDVRLPGTTMSFGSVQNDTLKSYYFEGNIGSNVVVLGKNELSSPRQLGGEVIIKKL